MVINTSIFHKCQKNRGFSILTKAKGGKMKKVLVGALISSSWIVYAVSIKCYGTGGTMHC
jgi:hypothetical protein